MTIKTIGNAIAFACAFVAVNAAQAIEVAEGNPVAGPAFTTNGDKDRDSVKPWHVYFDPTCDSAEVPTLTFNTTAFGAGPREHEHEWSQATFGYASKGQGGESHAMHVFGKSEKYEVSNFHEFKHHSHWKPDPEYCTPVPEPQTYALLMAGLGAMTFVARRRKTASK